MRILVTGASGFVGGALWRAAREAGHAVTALGRRVVADRDYHACDLARGLELDLRPEAVVHAAARSSPWGSSREFAAQNVAATRNVVEFCETRGRPLLVHISTSAVMYASEHQLNLDEQAVLPAQPINRYAATKREAEALVRAYSGPWCIVRPRAVFGPGDTVLFPRILRAARSGRLPLIESTPPVVGDLIYIDTLVAYLLRIIRQRATGLYLLTNNLPVPLLDFLGGVLAELGIPAPRRRVPVRRAMLAATVIERCYALLPFLGEPPLTRFGVSAFAYSKTFNVAKAVRDLGPPAVSLTDGVGRFVRWQRQQPA
jgi:nucleoside-diphosphate-sugar epimerase